MRRAALVSIARVVVWAVLTFYWGYLVVANVVLSTGLFDLIANGNPDFIAIQYTRAWTWLPGRVHVENLAIRGRDDSVEWRLTIDSADFDFEPMAMLQHRAQFGRVHGEGVSFRLRRRLERPPTSVRDYADLPSIAGFGPFAVRPPYTFDPDYWSDAYYHLWGVRLAGISAEHVREVWIDNIRFTGDARIAGRFDFKPLRAVDVGPVQVDIAHGQVTRGPTALAVAIAGRVEGHLERFDPRFIQYEELLRRLSVSTELRGAYPNAGADIDRPVVTGPVELARAAVHIVRGFVVAPSRIQVVMPRLELAGAQARLQLAAMAELGVAAHVPAALRLDFAAISAWRSDALVAVASRASALGTSPILDLAHLRSGARLRLNLPLAELVDAHTAAPRTIVAGRGHLSARVDVGLQAMDASGSASLALVDFVFRHARGVMAVPSVRLDVATPHLDLLDPLHALVADFELHHAQLTAPDILGARRPESAERRLLAATAAFRGQGRLTIAERLGQFELALESEPVIVALRDREVRAALAIHARVRDWQLDHGKLALEADAELRGLRGAGMTVDRIAIHAAGAAIRLADPTAHLRLRADVEGGRLRSAAALAAWLPHDVGFAILAEDGRFAGWLQAELDGDRWRARAELSTRQVGVALPRVRLLADVTARLALRHRPGRLEFEDARLEVRQLVGELGQGHARELTVSALTLAARVPDFDGRWINLRTAELFLSIEGAELADARALHGFFPAGSEVELLSGRLSLGANLSFGASRRGDAGSLQWIARDARLRFRGVDYRGQVGLYATVRAFHPESLEFDLSGSQLDVRDLSVRGSSADTSGWRGTLRLQGALLGLDPTPRFDAQLALQATDARPVLAAATGSDLPEFLVGWVDMSELRARALLHAETAELTVRHVEARGGASRVHGQLRLGAGGIEGGFIFDEGPLSFSWRADRTGGHFGLGGSD